MRLLKSILCAAAGAAIWASAAQAEDFKFANFMPPTHPYVAGAFQPFADAVKAGTDGEITLTLYNGGELGGGPVEQYARVLDGVAEFVVSLPGYTASAFPLTLVAELPGVLKEDTGTETLWKNIDLFQKEYRRAILISLWSSAENILYMRDKAVHSPADIAGLKIRVPSRNTGYLVEAWGATPVSMPVSEIYNAMQTGVIDGAMIDGTATKAFRLGEVANYITMGMNTTNSPFFILMNRDAYNGLTEEQQKAIKDAGKEASKLGNQVQLTVAANGIKSFAEMDGKEVIKLSDEEAAAFNELSKGVVEKVVSEEGGDAQAILDALQGS